MAKMRDFNPKAVLVVRKASGVSLGGRRYLQGQAISDDCISLRKRMQLFKQNYLCYAHDLPDDTLKNAEAREASANEPTEEEGLGGDGTAEEVQENGLTEVENRADAEADASRPEGSDESEGDDDDNSGEEGSDEPSEPVASKKKRSRKKKTS